MAIHISDFVSEFDFLLLLRQGLEKQAQNKFSFKNEF